MLITKQQFAQNVCSDPSRPELNRIRFDQIGAVSCDGKRILIVPYPVIEEDLFETEETAADAKYKLQGGEAIYIKEEQAKQIANAFFKPSDGVSGCFRYAVMEQKDGKRLISLVNPEQKIRKEFVLEEDFDLVYPDYYHLLPKSDATLEIYFDLGRLIDLLSKVRKAADTFEEAVRFRFHGEKGLLEILYGDPGKEVRAFINPYTKQDKEE